MNRTTYARNPREIIESLRQERGYASTRALAIAAGIPQPTLARYLKGTSETMELANWMALAKELDVTVSELLGEVPIATRAEAQELMNTLLLLDESHRSALLAAAKAMAAQAKKSPTK